MSNETEDLELGNYRVLHKEDSSLWMLGRGGYGTTYKAEHKHLGRVCALKVINDNLMRNNDAKRRFLQEAQAAALLDHPHIARVYDFGESDGVFYYAMTYCAGGDLEEFSKSRGPQPWSVVRELAQQILPALGMAHTNGLLHRDLKPSNIMLADDDGTVSLRLIDFGLVKVLEHHESASTNLMLTQEGSFMGNPLTASPEQLREEDLDERSDLFSLGVTLWYLLAGCSPFGGVATAELVHQRLSGDSYDPMLPEDLDDEGRGLLSRLLSKDKAERFRNAEEAMDFLKEGAKGAPKKKARKKGKSKKAKTKAAVAEARDSEPAVAAVTTPRDWSEIWEIHEQLKKFNYGTYYYCAGLVSGVPGTTLFVPDSESPYVESVREHADKILNADTHLLNGYFQKGKLSEETAYVSPPFPSGDLQCLLHVFGNLNLQEHLPIYQQIATAVDESIARDIPGVELDITDVMLGARDHTQGVAQTHAEWHEFFQNQKDAGADYMANLEITVLPKLVDSADIEEAMVTLGGDDLATNPVARFGGLLYRTVSGMSVKQSAYLSPSAHVSTSNVSEESNRYLSEVIAAREMPESAMEMLKHLCELEGVEWDTGILEATLSAKDQRRDEVTRTHASMHSLVASVLPPKKIEKTKPREKKQAAKKAPKRAQLGKPATVSKKQDPQQLTASQAASTPIATISRSAPAHAVQPAKETRKRSKKGIIIVSASVLCLALIGGLAWWMLGEDEKPKRRSGGGDVEIPIAQVANPVTLQFADVTVGKTSLPAESTYTIADSEGTLLARFMPVDGTAQVENISAELFDGDNRWPLKLELVSTGYTITPVMLDRSDFKDEGDDRRGYTKSLKLAAQAYTDITPEVKFNGSPLQMSVAAVKNQLRSDEGSALDWKLTEHEGKLRVILPPGKDFPVKALVTFPGMKELFFNLEQGSQPEWNLEVEQREVKITGLADFVEMKFAPDFSKLPDSAIKKSLQANPVSYTAKASDFNNGTGSWKLPALPGKVTVKKASGGWSFALTADAEFRVLTSADRSGTLEMGSGKFLKLIKQAEKGNVDAQFKIGLIYFDGDGVTKNEEASTCWFRLGALGGDKAAQFNYALNLELGVGVRENMRDAVTWYRKAADQGHVKAQLNLGLAYQDGRGVKQSYKEAESWLNKSADGGSAEGMFNLAVLYGDSAAGRVNHKRAVELYTKASDLGFAPAMYNLGVHYENGMGGLKRDKAKAMELYRKAAAKGYKNAIDLLKERE